VAFLAGDAVAYGTVHRYHDASSAARRCRKPGGHYAPASMKAPDVMTREARVIPADETIATALELLAATESRHLPVVGDDGELVGMLSDRDLRALLGRYDEDRASFAEAWNSARMPVRSAMTRNPIAVGDDADLEEVVELLIDQKVGALPVVDAEKKVLGIISYIDVLRAWQREHEAIEAPALLPTTAALRDRARGAQGDWDEPKAAPSSPGPARAVAKKEPAQQAAAGAVKRSAGRGQKRPR
jgi:CBS domain-containing membrane protein